MIPASLLKLPPLVHEAATQGAILVETEGFATILRPDGDVLLEIAEDGSPEEVVAARWQRHQAAVARRVMPLTDVASFLRSEWATYVAKGMSTGASVATVGHTVLSGLDWWTLGGIGASLLLPPAVRFVVWAGFRATVWTIAKYARWRLDRVMRGEEDMDALLDSLMAGGPAVEGVGAAHAGRLARARRVHDIIIGRRRARRVA